MRKSHRPMRPPRAQARLAPHRDAQGKGCHLIKWNLARAKAARPARKTAESTSSTRTTQGCSRKTVRPNERNHEQAHDPARPRSPKSPWHGHDSHHTGMLRNADPETLAVSKGNEGIVLLPSVVTFLKRVFTRYGSDPSLPNGRWCPYQL